MTQAATRELIISRVFDAPRPLVYRAFVDPDQLAQWFGPVGYSVPRDTVQIDARPGGREHYVMMNQGDRSVCHTIDSIFTEVIENEVLAGYQDELAWRSGLRRCAGCVRCVPLAPAAPIPVAATAYRDPPPKRSDLSRWIFTGPGTSGCTQETEPTLPPAHVTNGCDFGSRLVWVDPELRGGAGRAKS